MNGLTADKKEMLKEAAGSASLEGMDLNKQREYYKLSTITLEEFILRFVLPNSLIRLWVPIRGGYQMLRIEGKNDVCMEHEIVKNKVWQSDYKDFSVIGVNDILVDDFYKEAINIVIDNKKCELIEK